MTITKPAEAMPRRVPTYSLTYLACLAPWSENPTDADRRFDRVADLAHRNVTRCIGRERYVRRTSNEIRSLSIVAPHYNIDKRLLEEFTTCPQLFFVMHKISAVFR